MTLFDPAHRFGLRIAYRLMRAYWGVVHPTERAAHVVVRVGERILFVRNSYRPGLGFPAGRARWWERSEETASRELGEEVGLHVQPADLRPAGRLLVAHEQKRDDSWFYELRLPEEPPLRIDRREVIWAGFQTLAEATDLGLNAPTAAYLFPGSAPPT